MALQWMIPIVVLVACDAIDAFTAQQSGVITGHRCCGKEHLPCIDPLEDNRTFSPPLRLSNLSQTNQEIIPWSFHFFRCSEGFTQTYYELGGNENYLVLKEDGVRFRWKERITKETKEYCVTYLPQGGYQAAICRPDPKKICNKATCIQKCCDVNEEISIKSLSCVKRTNRRFFPMFRSPHGEPLSPPKDTKIITQVPKCKSLIMITPEIDPSEEFRILRTGRLYHPSGQRHYAVGGYCTDDADGWSVPVALVCMDIPDTQDLTKIYIQAAGVMVSCVFLMVTIIFHILIPILRDMQGLCFLCHMISLLVANVALSISYLVTHKERDLLCVINGMVLQISFLATFFWLNVMCFDIWRVIRATVHLVPLTGILADDSKKFKAYSVYAWGGPLIVTSITALLHFLPDQFVSSGVIRPHFGVGTCFFQGDLEVLSYFYSLVGPLFLVNLVLIAHTIVMLFQARNAFNCCRKTESPRAFNASQLDAFWQRFGLFTLMAVCWVTEILSWKIPPTYLWFVTDFLNSLQGLVVFLIFLASRKKRQLVLDLCIRTTTFISHHFKKIPPTLPPA